MMVPGAVDKLFHYTASISYEVFASITPAVIPGLLQQRIMQNPSCTIHVLALLRPLSHIGIGRISRSLRRVCRWKY